MVTLHEELQAILEVNANRWMSLDELANAVNGREHYRKGDGSPVEPGQIHLRTRTGGSYERLFERQGRFVRARPDMPPSAPVKRDFTPPPETTPAVRPNGLPASDSDSAASVLDAAITALRGQRWDLDEAPQHIPREPGLYAIYGDRDVWLALGLGVPPDDRPLYVGKSESSLADRDVRAHLGSGRTGSSTVRRSFAALLHERLDLRGIPRNPSRPERFAHYGLARDADERLTTWMRKTLQVAVWPTMAGVELGPLETAVLQRLRPPLNLTGVVTAWAAQVKAARAVMAAEARRWAAERARP